MITSYVRSVKRNYTTHSFLKADVLIANPV